MENSNQESFRLGAVIFARKDKEDASGRLEEQMRVCEEYAKRHNLQVITSFREVGSDKAEEREELDELMRFCVEHKKDIAVIIVTRADRLMSDVFKYSALQDALANISIAVLEAE